MKTFEDFGLNITSTPELPPAEDFAELALKTYANLGLVSDGDKAREAFSEKVDAISAALPEDTAKRPFDIVIVPKLGELSLNSLIERYDELTSAKGNYQTYIWSELWDQYSADELNQGQATPIEPRAVLLAGGHDEPGLYFTNQNLKKQRKSLEDTKEVFADELVALQSMSPAEYIIRNAMLLERGEPLQDTQTFTRFIELDEKTVDGRSYVPNANSNGYGRLLLYGSGAYAFSYAGVRLSVGLK